MEVEGSWTEVFECSEGKQARGEDELLGSSTLTLAPLLPRPPPAQRSQPLVITKSRTKGSRPLTSSVPSIPNPFPELCSPSQSPVLIGSHSPQSSNTHLVKVCGEDSHSRCLWVSAGATVREVCDILVQTAHCSDQKNWALVELHQSLGLDVSLLQHTLGLDYESRFCVNEFTSGSTQYRIPLVKPEERCLEDHEVVQEVQARWNPEGDTKLVFRKNYAKYEFFRKPTQFFPQNMISDSADVTKGMTSSELIQNMPGACPEIQGFLHMKERSRKTWKRIFFFLRRSGLYFSIKGSSKEPRHLQCIDELKNLNVYTITNSCKLYGAPVDFTFCVKPCKDGFRAQNLTLLCAENEQTRTCWVSAFRLFKYGSQLQQNFQRSQSAPQSPEVTLCTDTKAGQRIESEDSLVAMDFSGKAGGRVIQNPREAQSAEREEGQAWRRREALRYSLPNPSLGSCPSSIHRTQPWFHGGVSRREAEKLIEEQGHVDGMFLIRESQQHSQCFVLSLCHKLRTKHYLIIPCDEGGRNYYTMTDGETLFIDLLQLVEFHQINKGSLPVCLKHPCVCVAL